ncbi:MAG: S8/S53 family peptidase [Oscillospiraceae bacterium]|nr:S8/S53 family peptidase [Oscillospiraceae bacterium]
MKNKKNVVLIVVLTILLALSICACKSENADSSSPDVTVSEGLNNDVNRTDNVETNDNNENQADNIVGIWELIDVVENIDNFDPMNLSNNLNFTMQINRFMFFEEGFVESTNRSNVRSPITHSSWTDDNFVIFQWMPNYLYSFVYSIHEFENTSYLFVKQDGFKPVDYETYTIREGQPYGVFTKISNIAEITVNDYDDINNLDVHLVDFSNFDSNFFTLTFNDRTVFPNETERLPHNNIYHPEYILEAGKNPGLGVRSLHNMGITGIGVNIAIIDNQLQLHHPEYYDNIAEYIEFKDIQISEYMGSMSGSAIVSLLVGKTIGVAPDAKVYYYSAYPERVDNIDAEFFIKALDQIIEKNKELDNADKIRAVVIWANPLAWANGDLYLESVIKAQEAGILVLDSSEELTFIAPNAYDYLDPEDVSLCVERPTYPSIMQSNKDIIYAPSSYRTVAESYREGYYNYRYFGMGGVGFTSIPYVAGVLALGWQVRPELTSDEIVDILFQTAYVDLNGLKHIYPTAFIDYLLEN